MAWDDITPGGGYSWTPSTATQHGFAQKIDPQRRANYEASTPGRTWPWQTPKGRGDVDRQHWVKPGPSYDDRSGYATGNLGGSNYRNIELANRRGIGSIPDEDEGMGMIGHAKQFFSGLDLPMPKMMKLAGDTFNDAMRGVRLHSDYKDRAVAAGGTKAEGSKAWEADKRAMMTADDRAFEKKYLKLASLATDNEKAQEYRDTAETAWRNKQTSDRLSAASGFEGYRPDKYTDPSSIGYDRMQQISGGKWGGTGDTPGIADYSDPDEYLGGMYPDAGLAQGYEGNLYDRERQIKDLENQTFPGEDDVTDDITGDITFGGNERFEEQLAAEQPLPWEAQRQQAIFRNRPQGVRGMLGYGMEFDRMAYPYGEDFQDEVDEFWDISPRSSGRMVPYS